MSRSRGRALCSRPADPSLESDVRRRSGICRHESVVNTPLEKHTPSRFPEECASLTMCIQTKWRFFARLVRLRQLW